MRTRSLVAAGILGTVLITAARCTPEEITSLGKAVRSSQGVDDSILSEAKAAKGLIGLSKEDGLKRTKLLVVVDERVLQTAAMQVDVAKVLAESRGAEVAKTAAQQSITGEVPKRFTDDLEEVTMELVKEQVCQSVLDVMAPKPVEQGAKRTGDDIVQTAVDKMVKRRWNPPPDRWSGYVEWIKWEQGVGQAATQVSTGLLNGPVTIEMFARPPVQRAALAYARYCYPIPKLP